MKKVGLIMLSWVFWGISYYFSYPFISIYTTSFIPSQYVSLLYVLFTLFAIPMPVLGAKTSRSLGVVKTMWLGMFISGFGYLIVALAKDFTELAIGFIISYTTFLSLPNFYSYMSSCGKGVITRVWGFSILPSLFTPVIGGFLADYFGIRLVFLVAGVFNWVSSVPILFLEEKVLPRGKITFSRKSLIPILVIFPISLVFPYVYLEIKTTYNLNDFFVGVLATLAEIFGMFLTFISSYIRRPFLPVYLAIFSFLPLMLVSPCFSVLFGSWEAIIPSALEEVDDRSPETYASINSLQQIGWLMGFIASAISFSPVLSIFISSGVSLTLALFLFLTGRELKL